MNPFMAVGPFLSLYSATIASIVKSYFFFLIRDEWLPAIPVLLYYLAIIWGKGIEYLEVSSPP